MTAPARGAGTAAVRGRVPLPDGSVLLVSAFDTEDSVGGGLFAWDGRALEVVDRLSTTGLHHDGSRLVRCLWSDLATPCDLLVYDRGGVRRYQRVDGASNPHDVRLHAGAVAVVATAENRVLWVDPDGRVTRTWAPRGEPDSWHLNGLAEHAGRLHVSAFGRFERRRGWDRAGQPASGCVVDLDGGAVVLSGLSAPHSPRVLDGSWVVCNSGTHELVAVDPPDRVRRRARLGGWTRGLDAAGGHLYVGVSPRRREAARHEPARVVALDRSTWEPTGELTVPGREIYDVAVVPDALAAGVRRGFAGNVSRRREEQQLAMFARVGRSPARLWAVGDPLPAAACRAHVTVPGWPDAALPGELLSLECRVANTGSAILTSAPPHPVRLTGRWLGPGGPQATEFSPSRLPASVPPGQQVRLGVLVRVPEGTGSWELELTLEQVGVGVFADYDGTNATRLPLVVTAAPRGVSAP